MRFERNYDNEESRRYWEKLDRAVDVIKGNAKPIKWEQERNGLGSVDYWYIIEPIGTFIHVFPINGEHGTVYKVDGPQLDGVAEYPTLARAKEVAEDLCRFSEARPLEMAPIDLRDYPDCGVEITNFDGTQVFDAHTIAGEYFTAPSK
jgi:hypothetical protein